MHKDECEENERQYEETQNAGGDMRRFPIRAEIRFCRDKARVNQENEGHGQRNALRRNTVLKLKENKVKTVQKIDQSSTGTVQDF